MNAHYHSLIQNFIIILNRLAVHVHYYHSRQWSCLLGVNLLHYHRHINILSHLDFFYLHAILDRRWLLNWLDRCLGLSPNNWIQYGHFNWDIFRGIIDDILERDIISEIDVFVNALVVSLHYRWIQKHAGEMQIRLIYKLFERFSRERCRLIS